VARSFDLLPPVERVRLYREMAQAAVKLAGNAPTPDIKASYMNLATNWHDLATGLEMELEAGWMASPATRKRGSGAEA
jgi:hypothetical protein